MSIKSMTILLASVMLSIVPLNGQSMDHTIEGVTWLDFDDNGIRTVVDKILPQVKVDLFNEQGAMIQFTFSDSDGNYSFPNLSSGLYYIKFEKKQGLKMALNDAGDDNIDSDIASNGISDFFLLDSNTPEIKLDAGFRSSILIQTKAFVHVCEGQVVEISPTILGDNGSLSFYWSHDGSTLSSSFITPDSNTLITVTVTDSWNIPVEKNIFIKLTKGVSSKACADVDIFDFSAVPIDIFVSENNPGPITVTDINELFIGGGRRISIELLDGANISSINSSESGVFINNCSGCRTKTTLTYFSPTNEYLDISKYEFFELTEMKIDQGNVGVTISVEDDNSTSTLSDKIESEGPNTDILPVFFFQNFDKYDQIDFSKLRSISLTFTSINESIDILMSSILSCKDEQCFTTLLEAQDICLSDSVALVPESTCTEGLIFLWEDLGFGKEKTVTPIDTSTYNLTVYDQNGCTEMLSTAVNVNQPPSLILENPEYACFGESIRIDANVSGGMPPYSYLWNNNPLNSSFLELVAAIDTTINLIVTDSLGCMASAQTTIIVNENPSISLNVTNSLCSQPTGSIKANINGGTPPYSLEWSNGVMNQDSITNLDFGLYSLEVTDSLGCSSMASALVNYIPCASLGNYVWHDLNYNGIQDSSDLPLQGVVVLLKNQLNEEISRDTTDEDGIYLFEELESGAYLIEYIPPAEFYPTLPYATINELVDSNADTLTHNSDTIILADYEKNLTIDAGWYKKVCLGDQVWNDINLNHYLDSLDQGIEDVVVKLFDCNNNLLDSTTTDIIGNYSFCDLDPGEYALQFCNPEGFVPVNQNIGNDTIDSDINIDNSTTDCKSLSSGDTLTICDAGFHNISSIGDYVWHDLNANGLQEQGEPSVEGITLNLYNCDSIWLSTTITDSTGFYLFDSLPSGTYYLEVSPLPNSILSPQHSGLDSLVDSDFSSIDYKTSCIDLGAGEDLRDIDTGLYYESSIGDYVWIDYDLNGLQDPDEEALEGLKIYLFYCDENLIDSTYSDTQGYYLFEGLMPGQYYIKVELLDQQELTIVNDDDSTLNNDIDKITLRSECVTLSSQQSYIDLDIGVYNLGKIGDLVWFDENGNGIQDPLEEGAPDIIVTLLDCDDNVLNTTITDHNGEYCFSDLPYGDYKVHFDIPEPYALVGEHQGMDSTLDSNPNPATNTTECITVSAPLDSTVDAGISTCSTIGGTAWFDTYKLNSVKDAVENGVNGIKVNAYKRTNGLWKLENVSYTSLKPGDYSEDGYWEMCVAPGEYYIEFSNISVIEAVEPNQGNDEYLDSDAVHTHGINTTDIINVLPGIDNLSIGIGYRWKTTFGKIPQSINSNTSRIIFDELKSTITIENESANGAKRQDQIDLNSYNDTTPKKVNIYPNPSTGLINVHFPEPLTEPLDFIIYENTGRRIKTHSQQSTTNNQTWAIQIKDLQSGLHHLQIKIKDKIEWLPFIKI